MRVAVHCGCSEERGWVCVCRRVDACKAGHGAQGGAVSWEKGCGGGGGEGGQQTLPPALCGHTWMLLIHRESQIKGEKVLQYRIAAAASKLHKEKFKREKRSNCHYLSKYQPDGRARLDAGVLLAPVDPPRANGCHGGQPYKPIALPHHSQATGCSGIAVCCGFLPSLGQKTRGLPSQCLVAAFHPSIHTAFASRSLGKAALCLSVHAGARLLTYPW